MLYGVSTNHYTLALFMTTHHDNFRSWYVDTLEFLYPRREAGFPILMIVFPLLERYIRQKVGLPPQSQLTDKFYDELRNMFPELTDKATAEQFWQVYRNGLLHEVTISRQNRKGDQMPVGRVSHDRPRISVDPDGSFWIHPVDFAKRVTEVIEADFATFEGVVSASQLPSEKVHASGVQQAGPTVLGTSTEP